jgi:hypothetical protein
MKNITSSRLLSALALLLFGCVPSVNPLYTEQTLTFEPKLLGTWFEKDAAKDAWIFTAAGEKKYNLTIREEDDKSSPMIARLVKLDTNMFLDLALETKSLEDLPVGAFYKSAIVPGHLIIKVGKIGETLELSLPQNDWLKEELRKKPESLAHTLLEDDRVVLTASTADLQNFFKKHARTAGLWGDPGVLKKRSP